MKNLTKLFRLLQITRSQPQYGYALSEISKHELSDLAQHHYLVTFIAWQLARLVKRSGAHINIEKVLEFSLIHDLGELFGGDISMPYAKANPIARDAAKKFERLNQQYLARFFDKDQKHFEQLAEEIMDAQSDEALIAKIADYIECTHYKLYAHRFSKNDTVMAVRKIETMLKKITDDKARLVLNEFLVGWAKELNDGELIEIFEAMKSQ